MNNKLQAWIHAARLRTLPLSVSGVIMGSAMALHKDIFRADIFFSALVTTLLLQILSNLANDYGDFSHGTDNDFRVGPKRAVQSGKIKPGEMKWAIFITGLLAFFMGLYLLKIAFNEFLNPIFLLFLLVGFVAIGAAIKYTVGKNPFGYQGLGDLMVFIFFGIVAVLGTYFLHTQKMEGWMFLPALTIGLLSVGVLNINNMRDVENDKTSGKKTIPVRMGPGFSKKYHMALMVISFICLELYFLHFKSYFLAGSLLIPFSFIGWHILNIWRNEIPKDFDPELKRLSLTTLLIACWCGLGSFI